MTRGKKHKRLGTCFYHLCRKDAKVRKCNYCRESFCREHLMPKLPGLPRFQGTKTKDHMFMEEWHKKGEKKI